MNKKIEPTGEVCIKFTDEEMSQLGIKEGDKFSIKEDGEGILLQKFSTMELDLSEMSREVLEMLVEESCNKDKSVNDVISEILESYLEKSE